MDCVFTIPTEGAEAEVASHEDKLMGSYSFVYPSIMKNTMHILHVSPSNRVFGGNNLMVAVVRAMGHYKETFK